MNTRKEDPVRKRSEEEYAAQAERQRAYRKTEAGKAAAARRKEYETEVKLRLHKVHDADILSALTDEIPLATQLKDLLREAVAIRKVLNK